MKKIQILTILLLLVGSGFVLYDGGIKIPHGEAYDRTLCVSCHDEWSPEHFESYQADMRVHAPTLSIVVVNEVKGILCNVSGLEIRGWVQCADLFTPNDLYYERTRG